MTASVDSVGSVGASRSLRFYLNHFPLVASTAAFLLATWCGCGSSMAISAVAAAVAAYFTLRPTKIEGGERYSAVVIGAGFSGIAAGIKLGEAGVKYTILEKSASLGGTWWDNKYPGAACDVASHLYSYSFFLNPWWSRAYSQHAEIRSYLETVADHYDVRRHIHFGKKVSECVWDEATRKWTVTTADGDAHTANFVITGAGALHVPSMPNFKGQSDFKGPLFHTAQWRSDVSLKGKRVAVIGTGASAVQVVPNIANDVKDLYVFQRTACWSPPRMDFQYYPWAKYLFAVFPPLMRLHRFYYFWRNELYFHLVFSGRFNFYVARLFEDLVKKYVHKVIPDPQLADNLIPKYQVGCKRITPSDHYIKAFRRDNVHLVTDPISSLTSTAVCTDKQEIPVDFVIVATGFDILSSFRAFKVVGKGGKVITDVHGDMPKAFNGTVCPDFPNLFILLGPNTGLGHNTIIYVIECQMNYALDCIRQLISSGRRSMEVRADRQADYVADIYASLKQRVWSLGGCISWYKNAKNESFILWPYDLVTFWNRLRKADIKDFTLAS